MIIPSIHSDSDTAPVAPLVTVIVTVYRRVQFLRSALESVLSQTFRSYEIIVTDDSNLPEIREICETFAEGDRLRYRSNEKVLGAPLNIRAAIVESRGRYIAIINDDDAWEPRFLERLIAPLEHDENRVLAFSDHWIMNDEGMVDPVVTESNTKLYGRALLPEGDVTDLGNLVLRQNGVPLAMASVFRKHALDLRLLTQDVVGAYDLWISCILAATGNPFYYVPERLTRYRVHGGSETARKAPEKALPMIFIFKEIIRRDLFPSMELILRQRLSRAYFRCGRDMLWYGRCREARSYFIKSFLTSAHWKAGVAWGLSLLPTYLRRAARLQH